MKYFSLLVALLNTFFLCYVVEAQETSQSIAFHSQASQDHFVYTLLYEIADKQDPGYYLEIGSGDPEIISNSYFLEKALNWNGISLDLAQIYRDRWDNLRKNPLIIGDATQANYDLILRDAPTIIDYLSLDIDNYYDIVLQKLPLDRYLFRVITIEHDYYRFGNAFREKERAILQSYGYYLLCPDVTHPNCGSFEDWWIHPATFSTYIFNKLASLDLKQKDHAEIVRLLQTLASD